MLREYLETKIRNNWNYVNEYRSETITDDRKLEIEEIFYGSLLERSSKLNRELVIPIIRNRLRFMGK